MPSSSTQSGRNWKEYVTADFAGVPIDLRAASGKNAACRRVRCVAGSGTVTLTSQHGTPADALTLAAGDWEDVQAIAITAVTGITRLRVIW